MTTVEVVQVDERDSGWEEFDPRFRVYLHGSGESSTAGWSDTYDITGADLAQVLGWARQQAGDTLTYAIALVCDEAPRGRGLVWLVGMDGNDDTTTDPARAETQRRMLARRAEPIEVPASDQMPPETPGQRGSHGSSV